MGVVRFDHVAIPTANPEAMLRFYHKLGFTVPTVEDWRERKRPYFAIQFGDNKINVHAPELWRDEHFSLRGTTALPGCGDFCFVWEGTVASLSSTLAAAGAAIVEGPVEREGGRDGGRDRGTSIYTRDPDANLLEFIVYG
jgi:catechol 2,3-dioxygenase-like lactoylglutathione lyase family enzyme